VQTEFSIPIEVGMLGDKPLNISEKGFHGLQLNILCAWVLCSKQFFSFL